MRQHATAARFWTALVVACLAAGIAAGPRALAQVKSSSSKNNMSANERLYGPLRKQFREAATLINGQHNYKAGLVIMERLEKQCPHHTSLFYQHVLMGKCQCLVALKQYQRFDREAEHLLTLSPRNTQLLHFLAIQYLQTDLPHHAEHALALLDRMNEKDLNDDGKLRQLIARCNALLLSGRATELVKVAESGYKRYPCAPLARYAGYGYSQLKRYKEAASWYETAAHECEKQAGRTVASDDKISLLYNCACNYRRAGNEFMAIKKLDEILAVQPHHVLSLLFKLDCYESRLNRKRYKHQIESTALAIQDKDCGPKEIETKYNILCALYANEGKPKEAIACIEKAYALTKRPACFGQIGDIFERQGDYTTALNYYQRRYALEPTSVVNLCHMSNCEGRLQHVIKALAYAEEAIRLKPDNAEAHKLKGALLCASGNMQAAARETLYLHRPFMNRDYSVDDLRSIGVKYCSDITMYLRQATAGWELADTAKLEEISVALQKETDTQKRAHLLAQRADVHLLGNNFASALADTDAVIALGCGSYQIHALRAAALLGLKQNAAAKAERALTVKLYVAAKNTP